MQGFRPIVIQDGYLTVLPAPSWKPPVMAVSSQEIGATTGPAPIDDWTTRARSLRVARESLDEMRPLLFRNEKKITGWPGAAGEDGDDVEDRRGAGGYAFAAVLDR